MGLRLFLLVALWGSTLWADFKVSGDWLEIAQPHFRVALPDGFVQVTPRTPPQDWNCVMAWVGEDAAGTGFTASFHVTHETLAPDSDLSGQFRPRTPPVASVCACSAVESESRTAKSWRNPRERDAEEWTVVRVVMVAGLKVLWEKRVCAQKHARGAEQITKRGRFRNVEVTGSNILEDYRGFA